MRTVTKLRLLMIAIVLASGTALAQKKKQDAAPPTDASRFNWDKSKIIPKLERLAIVELTVNYKLTTTAKTITQEDRSGGKIAGARVTGFLEFTDSEPTQADYQAITDHFYRYFQKKLKENGIDTVGWDQVTASEFYQKSGGEEGEKEDAQKEGGGNKWVTSTANKGKVIHKGLTGFAGGKGKRAMEFGKEFGTAATFKVNVDFADVMVNLDIKSTDRRDVGGGWYYPATTSKKYTWGVHAQMMVGDQENKEYTYIWAGKGFPEFLMQWSDIPVAGEYAESVTEDVSKARSGLAKGFAFRKELDPVLIQTSREKYIAAARNAVEKWVDAFVTRAVQMRKS
ncbi:hypothetical protein [Pseudochryseolinea flava]|uniref:Uncharacterized protein n=1 Tax=Pseudochryseolinea flava TaxID=2059302 RepID=A0A364Y661_9BACT|nr:hypothetical protein [Pseudochryseolinea flava]RAW02541.1 hypothetical protein DQQ10_00015 [Pseudochryseolinea flava]